MPAALHHVDMGLNHIETKLGSGISLKRLNGAVLMATAQSQHMPSNLEITSQLVTRGWLMAAHNFLTVINVSITKNKHNIGERAWCEVNNKNNLVWVAQGAIIPKHPHVVIAGDVKLSLRAGQ